MSDENRKGDRGVLGMLQIYWDEEGKKWSTKRHNLARVSTLCFHDFQMNASEKYQNDYLTSSAILRFILKLFGPCSCIWLIENLKDT